MHISVFVQFVLCIWSLGPVSACDDIPAKIALSCFPAIYLYLLLLVFTVDPAFVAVGAASPHTHTHTNMHLETFPLLSAMKGGWYLSGLCLSHAERYRPAHIVYRTSALDKDLSCT